MQLDFWGSAVSSQARSEAEPQPKSNLVHFTIKIWHLVTTILIIFLRINWPNWLYAVKIVKANKGGGTNLKVRIGLPIICERSEPKICFWTVVRRIVAFCYAFLGNLPPKNIPLVFNFFTFPHLYPKGICLHLSMEWTPLGQAYTKLGLSNIYVCRLWRLKAIFFLATIMQFHKQPHYPHRTASFKKFHFTAWQRF